ncbi:hypothetical protein [Micromonospora sp. NPDC047074]|uniref:hypothetical protein n=1 Tax=Micromonospora sp. NPDC047074 TaxID=3154339 RepID=UPI0033C2F5BB
MIHWTTRLDETPTSAAGDIPVLRPDSPVKARLWDEVLTTQYDRVAPARPGARLVLAWGAEALPAARVYAVHSGSRLVVGETLDELVTSVVDSVEPHLVVIARTHQLRVRALAALSAAARESGRPVGFLCGRDAAGLSFSVAKALLLPRAGLTGIDVFDAPSHRAEENRSGVPEDLAGCLVHPALAKVLRSHGEGGHAKLPGVVCCGLPDEVEFADAPEAGCARPERRCKRAPAIDAEVVFADELAAPVVCFVCCNGFNVASELYPSSVSMAVSFVEGWSGALIAPIRPLVAPDEMVTALSTGLADGHALGRIVLRLNEMSGRIGQADAFVLHGDPCLALATTGGGEPAGVDAGAADDRDEHPAEWLSRVLRHAERGRRLLRAARAWLGDEGEAALDPLRTRFAHLERSTLNALKWAQVEPSGASRQRLLRNTTLIRFGIGQWDRALAQLLLESRASLDAFDIGHYDQNLAEIRPGDPCLRCTTPTEVHIFGADEVPAERRTAELCLVCGPIRASRLEGVSLTVVSSPRTGQGGEPFRLRAALRVPPPSSRLVDVVQVQLRFFDKANDRCVHQEARTVPAQDQTLDFDFDLPVDLGVDLHSIRLVAASGFDLAYARARFASLPGLVGARSGDPVR